MTLDRVGLGVVAALVEGAATRNDLPHLIRYADAVRALPDAAQLAAAHEATRQRNAVREWVDARLDRYPASHVAVELGRLVDRWGPSIESEEL